MYLPRAHAILAQCFEHGHWRLGESLIGPKTEGERGRQERGGNKEEGAVRENTFCLCSKLNSGQFAWCLMQEDQIWVQSASPLRVTSHIFKVHVKNKTSLGCFFQRFCACRELYVCRLKFKVKTCLTPSTPNWFTSQTYSISVKPTELYFSILGVEISKSPKTPKPVRLSLEVRCIKWSSRSLMGLNIWDSKSI